MVAFLSDLDEFCRFKPQKRADNTVEIELDVDGHIGKHSF